MEADLGKIGPRRVAAEQLRERLRVEAAAELVREHVLAVGVPCRAGGQPFLVLAGTVGSERVDRRLVEVDLTPALQGLRRTRHPMALCRCHPRVRNRQRAVVEVDVEPPQPEHLASTHARGHQQHERRVATMVASDVAERAQLVGRPRPILGPVVRRRPRRRRRVSPDAAALRPTPPRCARRGRVVRRRTAPCATRCECCGPSSATGPCPTAHPRRAGRRRTARARGVRAPAASIGRAAA